MFSYKRASFFIILAISFSLFAAIEDNSERLPSINWQKQTLATKVKNKVDGVLGSMLSKQDYLIDVEVMANTPEEPDFSAQEGGGAGSDAAEVKKNAEIAEADAKAKEEIEEKKRESKAQIKFSDDFNVETPEDFIVFNKFGLEAPLVDDFNDLQPDGKIILEMANDSGKNREEELKKEVEKARAEAQGLKNSSKGQNSGKLLWKLNSAMDIFENLKGVKIFLKISDKTTLEQRGAIEKYVSALKFNLGKIVPEIKFDYVALGQEPTNLEKALGFFNYLSKFSGIIAVLIGMLLFAFVGKSLIKKFFELSESGNNAMNGNFSMEGDNSENDENENQLPGGFPGGGDSIGANSLNGVERFIEYFNNAQTDAVLLIKKWIQEDTEQAHASLRSLVQQMKNDELVKVFSHLSENERSRWKKLLEQPLGANELAVANDFVGNQIVQSIIVPHFIEDPEVFNMLLKLSYEDVAKVVTEQPEVAGVLLNSLNSNFVNRVLEICEDKVRSKVLQQAMAMGVTEIKNSQGNLKSILAQYVSEVDNKPFNEKIIDLIPQANPATEEHLFSAFIESNKREVVIEKLREFYPANLISKLPIVFLKNILSTYPLDKKVNMLLSVDQDVKDRFVDIYAPEGSKASDMLGLEFENIENDQERFMKIKKESSLHWKDFVDFTRHEIKKEKRLKSEIDEVLIDWINSKAEGVKADLKLVS